MPLLATCNKDSKEEETCEATLRTVASVAMM